MLGLDLLRTEKDDLVKGDENCYCLYKSLLV